MPHARVIPLVAAAVNGNTQSPLRGRSFTTRIGLLYAAFMLIGQRLREIREAKDLRQGDIARATGLVQAYVSQVEHGHTVPGVGTLEKWAHALNMPLYQIMSEGDEPPKPLKIPGNNGERLWGTSRREASELNRLRRYLAKIDETDRKILLALAGRMVRSSRLT